MAAAGEAGVARVVEILRGELDRALALLGVRSIGEVTSDLVRFRTIGASAQAPVHSADFRSSLGSPDAPRGRLLGRRNRVHPGSGPLHGERQYVAPARGAADLIDTGFRDSAAMRALERVWERPVSRSRTSNCSWPPTTTSTTPVSSRSCSALRRRGRVARGCRRVLRRSDALRASPRAVHRKGLRGLRRPGLEPARGVLGRDEEWHGAGLGEPPAAGWRNDRCRLADSTGGSAPGHTPGDTLWYDDAARVAFCGDHLLDKVSSNTELAPTDRASLGSGSDRPR